MKTALTDSSHCGYFCELIGSLGSDRSAALTFFVTSLISLNSQAVPIVSDDSYSTSEDTVLVVAAPGVLSNDVAGANHVVSAVSLTPGDSPGVEGTSTSGATFTLNADGSFTYDPNGLFENLAAGDFVDDALTGFTTQYISMDDEGMSGIADIIVTITGVNDAPVLGGAITGSITEDAAASISGALTISDVDDGEGSYTVGVQAGTYGSLEITDASGAWTYTIDNSAGGATDILATGTIVNDVFTITTDDNNGSGGATTSIMITVTGVNDAPVMSDVSISVDENSDGDILVTNLVTTDVDAGDTFTYAITAGVMAPAEFKINGSQLLVGDHTPDQELLDFETTPVYSLTILVTDSGGLSDTATIVVNLTDVEDAPGATVCEEFDISGDSLNVLPDYLAPLRNYYAFTPSTPCHRVIDITDDYYMDQDLILVAASPLPSPTDTATKNYRVSLGDIPKNWDQDSSTLYFTPRQSTTALLSTIEFKNEAGTDVRTGEFVFEPTDGTNVTDDGVDNFVYRVCDDPTDESEDHCAFGVVYVNIARATVAGVTNDNLIADAEDLAQGPLELPVPAIPNVFVLLDDSENMASDILTSESEGLYAVGSQTKTYFLPEDGSGKPKYADSEANNPGVGLWRLRNSDYNKIYYNPAVAYKRWIGLDNSNSEYIDSDPTGAISNPYNTNSARIDLTATRNMPNNDRNVYLAKYYTWADINDPVGCPGNVVGTVDGTSPFTDPGGTCTEGTLVEIKPASAGGSDTYPKGTNREDCTGASTCTYAEEIQNFANFYSFSRTRHYTSKNSLGAVIAEADNMRIGFGAFGGTNDNINIEEMNESALTGNKGELLNHIYRNNAASNSTPIRDSLERTGRYFECLSSRTIITSGSTCPILSAPEGNCQQNFSLVVTAGFWNASGPGIDIINDDGDSDSNWDGGRYADSASQTLADVAMYFYERDLSSLDDEVPATARDLAGAAATSFGGSAEVPTMHQHMSTFVVTFGVSGTIDLGDVPTDYTSAFNWGDSLTDDEKLNDLVHTAVNGRGDYLNAADPSGLKLALESAFTQFSQAIGTASAVSFNSQEVQQGSLIYRAFYNTRENTGDLVAVEFNGDGTLGDQMWSAADQLDIGKTFNTREILTYDRTVPNGRGGIPFRSVNLNAEQKQALEDDPTDSVPSTDPAFAAQILKHVNYLRGDASNERPLGNLRERPAKMGRLGDIVSSTPVFYGTPSRARRANAPYPQGDLYADFKTRLANRREMVFVSSNDGMVHGFDANDGEEIFAYVPSHIIIGEYSQRIKQLLSTDYVHRYSVDLSNAVNDVYLDTDYRIGYGTKVKEWSSVLIGGYRAGGKGYFALDITDPDAITESNAGAVVLWEYTDADDVHPVDGAGVPLLDSAGLEISHLGYTYSSPTIALSNVRASDGENRWIAVAGNGYNSTGRSAVLFGLFIGGGTDGMWCRPEKPGCSAGEIDFVQIDTGQTDPGFINGLGEPRLIDIDGNGTVDLAYAGDRFGNLHRFDLRDPDPENWNSAVIFQAEYDNPSTSLTEAQPLTTQPLVVVHPTVETGVNCYTFDLTETKVDKLCGGYIVIFASGSYVFKGDDVSQDIQSIYGIWDTLGSTIVTKSSLVEQSYTAVAGDTNVGDVRVLSTNSVDYPGGDHGWYIDFDFPAPASTNPQYPGEKAIRNIQSRGGLVFVNSVIPKQQLSCTAEAGGAANVFCPATGSLVCAAGKGVFDVNNDGVIDAADLTTSGDIVASTYFEDAVPTDSTFIGGDRVTQLSDKSLEVRLTNTSGGENTGRVSWEKLKRN